MQGIGLAVGALVRILHLVALHFKIIVVTEDTFIPLDYLFRFRYVAFEDGPWHLSCDAGRTDDKSFVIAFQLFVVSTRLRVETFRPGIGNQLDKVVISSLVLCQHDEVVAALVAKILHLIVHSAEGHVHLTAEDGLERFFAVSLQRFVLLVDIVEELFYPHHVSVVGDSQASHPVGNCFVNEFWNTGLSIEQGILRMNV